MTAPHTECQPEAAPLRFTVTWDAGLYRVSVPNYDGGAVVDAASYDTLQARVDEMDAEVGMLREKLSDALAGGLPHRSDCAVYQAPAYEPEPCNCGVGVATDDSAYDLVRKLRGHNGWSRLVTDADAVSLVKSFVADVRGEPVQVSRHLDNGLLEHAAGMLSQYPCVAAALREMDLTLREMGCSLPLERSGGAT